MTSFLRYAPYALMTRQYASNKLELVHSFMLLSTASIGSVKTSGSRNRWARVKSTAGLMLAPSLSSLALMLPLHPTYMAPTLALGSSFIGLSLQLSPLSPGYTQISRLIGACSALTPTKTAFLGKICFFSGVLITFGAL